MHSFLRLICQPFVLLARVILTVILTPIIGFGYILLVLTFVVPSLILRSFVSFIAKLFDRDLGNLITVDGTLPARDYSDWYTAPSQSITVSVRIKGHVNSIEWLRRHVSKNLVHRLNVKTKRLEYPELQQYVTKRCGYLFFKWDNDFRVEDHVNVLDSKDILSDDDPWNTVLDEEGAFRIWEKLLRKPFKEKKSCWEILLVPHFSPKKLTLEEFMRIPEDEKRSVLFFRLHHGYTDGASLYRLLLTLTNDGVEEWERAYPEGKLSRWRELYAVTCGPFALAKEMSRGPDVYNPVHSFWLKQTGRYHIVKCTLPLETIKKARRAHLEIRFSSILLAAITGALRHHFLKTRNRLPLTPVKVGLAVPKPGHTWKLRNDYYSTYLILPIEKDSGRKRAFECEKRIQALYHGAITPFITQATKMIGSFPVECARFLTRKADYTLLYSEMKGPSKPLSVDGDLELEDLYYTMGLGSDDVAVGFNTLSYNGKIHLILTVDHAICPKREEASALMRLIEKEIDALQYGDCTNL